jgi:hypothetical protein
MKHLLLLAVFSAAGPTGCAFLTGKDEASAEFERETSADDARVREDKARTNLGALESAIADYVKAEKQIPDKLDKLVPKYIAVIPSLDLPACGRETEGVQNYPSSVLRDGVVDGALLHGSGRWGYVYNEHRVVVFIDCVKPSSKGLPWYQERGVF